MDDLLPAGNCCKNQSSCSLKTEWLNTRQAADYLCTTPAQVYNLVSLGKLPFYKFGRSNRFRRDELRQLLLARKRGKGVKYEYK